MRRTRVQEPLGPGRFRSEGLVDRLRQMLSEPATVADALGQKPLKPVNFPRPPSREREVLLTFLDRHTLDG